MNWFSDKINHGKQWLLTVAVKKVVKHYTPAIITSIAGAITAHQLGFIDVADGCIIIHIEDGLLWIVGAITATTGGAGVVQNKLKFEARKNEL